MDFFNFWPSRSRHLNPHHWQSLVSLGLMALLAALTLWLERISEIPDQRNDGKNRHDPDYIVEQMQVTRYQPDGSKRYSITTQHLVHYGDDETTVIQQPRAVFYSGEQPTYLQASSGTISADGSRVTLQQQVRIERPPAQVNGRELPASTLTTEELEVLPDDETAHSPVPVHLTRGKAVVDAKRMDASNVTGVLNLSGGVTGSFPR